MKIYVVSHKPFNGVLPAGYEYIQVNAANNPHFYPVTDDTGDNISAKNPYYCELTALYWIWKNDIENQIVGLAHYRRFLTVNPLSNSPKSYLNEKKVKKLLNKFDFLATRPYKSSGKVWEHICENVRRKDLQFLRQTISEVYPEYLGAYDEVMDGNKSYLCNILVCKKEMLNAYCQWLFCLLFALEPKVDMTGYTVQEQRLYGFLAERLFTVYVKHNNLKVKSFYTHLVGVSKRAILFNKLKKLFHIKKGS